MADNVQMTEHNVCTWQERGKSSFTSTGILLTMAVMEISDTSNTKMTSSNSFPNTSLEIHREVWHSFQDVASM